MTDAQVRYGIDEEWMNAPLGPYPKTNVSTPHKPDLQHFTPEQIEAHCEQLDNLQSATKAKGRLLIDSVQIIRQLQAQLKPSASHKCEQFYD